MSAPRSERLGSAGGCCVALGLITWGTGGDWKVGAAGLGFVCAISKQKGKWQRFKVLCSDHRTVLDILLLLLSNL